MSTRSELTVVSEGNCARYYRHHDGYPTSILDSISKILKDSTVFKDVLKDSTVFKDVQKAVLNLEGVRYEECYKGPSSGIFKDNNHGDLEWTYVINLDGKVVSVYNSMQDGEYLGSTSEMFKKGNKADPFDYVSELRDECQESERKSIASSIKAIEGLGFGINNVLGHVEHKPRGRDIITVVKMAKESRFTIELKSFTEVKKAEEYFISLAKKDSVAYAECNREIYLEEGYLDGFDFDLILTYHELL